MKYNIIGDNFPVLNLTLDEGEVVVTDRGAMAWRDQSIEMDTSSRGGLLKGFARSFAGEGVFLNTFKSTRNNSNLSLGINLPGKIVPMEIRGRSIICQKKSFLASEESVNLDVVFTKKFSAGLLGGEGFVLQKLTGNGLAFLEVDGSLVEKELKQGEVLLVDQGYLAYFEDTVNYEITTVKGFKNVLFGGEGLLLVKLSGHGKVGLQTLPASTVASSLIPYIPKSNS